MSSGLTDVLLVEAERLLSQQHQDGSMPSGRNGSYADPETPVRCTSHAVVSWGYAYRFTRDDRFLGAARKALGYLFEVMARSPGCVVVRLAEGKDQSNGVLGQAFVIEALHSGWSVFGIERARELGLELIRRHTFNRGYGCWNRVSPSGEVLTPDMTFNHQLYFAAVIALFRHDAAFVGEQVDEFIRGWKRTLQVRTDGRVVHDMPGPLSIRATIRGFLKRREDNEKLNKELDYHLYNCYAFSLLNDAGFDVKAGASHVWNGIVSFSESGLVASLVGRDQWSSFLRSGTETRVADLAYFRKTFGGDADLEAAAQFLMSVNDNVDAISPDPVNQRARSYRYWRLTGGHPAAVEGRSS